MGLAIPSVVAITLNLAIKDGILIKKNNLFENLNKLNAIIFDKTGTLFTQAKELNQIE